MPLDASDVSEVDYDPSIEGGAPIDDSTEMRTDHKWINEADFTCSCFYLYEPETHHDTQGKKKDS